MKQILTAILIFCTFNIFGQSWQPEGTKYPNASNEGDTVSVQTRIPLIDDQGLLNYYLPVGDLLELSPNVTWETITGNQGSVNISGFNNDAGYLNNAMADGRYLQSETDPTVPNNVKNITAGNIDSWNNSLQPGENVSELNNDANYTTITATDERYLRRDINDDNGINDLTLGGLMLPDLPVGLATYDQLVVNPQTGEVGKVSVGVFSFDVGNGSTTQFEVDSTTPELNFVGSGDTSVSFNNATNTVTITSTPGAGGGGAVTSFEGRDGAVTSQTGDYNTSEVIENGNLYFTEARVRNTDLAGLNVVNTPITPTNGFLQALGRLQGQINNREVSFSKNTAFNKNFGTTSGTVAQGNHTHTFASMTNKPTNLSGYGITNAYTKSETLQYFLRKDVSDTMNGTLTAVGFNGDGSGLTGVIKHNTNGVNTSTGGALNTNDGQIYYHSNSSNNYGGTLPSEFGLLYQFQGSTTNRHFGIFHNNNSTDFYLGSWDTNNNPSWNQIWHNGNLRSDSQNDSRYVQQTRTISTGTGLTGGGNLSSNRTINFDTSWGDSRYAVMNDINANYGQLTIKTSNDYNRGLRLINGNTSQSSFLYMDDSNDLNINNSSASSRPVYINKGGNGSLIVGGGINAGLGVLQNNADEILSLPSVAGGVMFNMQNSSGSDFATTYGSAFGLRGSNNERTFFLYKPNGASQDFYISDYGNNSSWRHSLLYHSSNHRSDSQNDARYAIMNTTNTGSLRASGNIISDNNIQASSAIISGAGSFGGRVSGSDAVSANEFVTRQQVVPLSTQQTGVVRAIEAISSALTVDDGVYMEKGGVQYVLTVPAGTFQQSGRGILDIEGIMEMSNITQDKTLSVYITFSQAGTVYNSGPMSFDLSTTGGGAFGHFKATLTSRMSAGYFFGKGVVTGSDSNGSITQGFTINPPTSLDFRQSFTIRMRVSSTTGYNMVLIPFTVKVSDLPN